MAAYYQSKRLCIVPLRFLPRKLQSKVQIILGFRWEKKIQLKPRKILQMIFYRKQLLRVTRVGSYFWDEPMSHAWRRKCKECKGLR